MLPHERMDVFGKVGLVTEVLREAVDQICPKNLGFVQPCVNTNPRGWTRWPTATMFQSNVPKGQDGDTLRWLSDAPFKEN